jgi:hypothetical protein
MKTIAMFNQNVTTGQAVSGSVFSPVAKHNEDAIVQVSMSVACTVRLQGRSASTAPWVNIRLTPAGDTSFTTSGYGTIPLFPEMRVDITGGASTSDVKVWLVN